MSNVKKEKWVENQENMKEEINIEFFFFKSEKKHKCKVQ